MEVKSMSQSGREASRGTATDHPEALPSPSPPSSTSFHPSAGRHYYVAVDRPQFKMETLVDLLGVAGRRPLLPVVLCCSSRDELDAVYSAVANLAFISSFPLYSDQDDTERASVLDKFHQSTIEWNQTADTHPDDPVETGTTNQKSCMIVVTDACLPFVTFGEAPLAARVLINYELPSKKDILNKEIIGRGTKRGVLYYMNDFGSCRVNNVQHSVSAKEKQIWLWHCRLGHPSFSYMKHLFPQLFSNLNYLDFKCDTCILAKMSWCTLSN